jgi:hypothetical protein
LAQKSQQKHQITGPVSRTNGNSEAAEGVAPRQQPAQQSATYNTPIMFRARCGSSSSFIHFW